MKLHELKAPAGSRKRRKVVGRGPGSGHGQTSGRGEKGQKARSGGGSQPWFEGGQLPLHRRVPKRGFTNIFRKEYAILNVKDLERFEAGTTVSPATLSEAGLVRTATAPVKILGEGTLSKALVVSAHAFSEGAAAKIRAAGGTLEVITS
ncbi:MAG: 50S ribosomal protein L15 [candidate division NC10 bacterium RIFCSPLOWO2_12_FULL_66_18]|nr:MAG: 50S ribosomal protein L15 [candidate division NC10 bacterium RIFCSPLOWO2_02_FULL_66_22]OGB96600.1 MAG: 50S ribosomal protein L15 [candidate division NC10 bacterium RIFCSPLOWO2_12_FULL_66_18]